MQGGEGAFSRLCSGKADCGCQDAEAGGGGALRNTYPESVVFFAEVLRDGALEQTVQCPRCSLRLQDLLKIVGGAGWPAISKTTIASETDFSVIIEMYLVVGFA